MVKKTTRRRGQQKAVQKSQAKSFVSHILLSILVMFGVVATYVSVVNASAVKGDEIRDLERSIAVARESAEQLAVDEAQLRSFATPAENVGFVPVDAQSMRVITVDSASTARTDVVAFAQN